ncbi:unnamed protein product [Discula destructiva]
MSRYLAVPSFDGPSDTRDRSSSTGSRHSSGSQPRPSPSSQGGGRIASGSSRAPSAVDTRGPPVGYPEATGRDPGRFESGERLLTNEEQHRLDVGKRVDLPAEAFVEAGGRHPFALRPGLGKLGKPLNVRVNQFRVSGLPNFDVYQYDVSLSPPGKKITFTNKVWNTDACQAQVQRAGKHPWVFDGTRLAWTRNDLPEMRFRIDMDEAQGRKAHPVNGPDIVYVVIKRTTTIRLDALRAYLTGKMGWDDHVLECMNFFDHVMREWPRHAMVAIKRNLYPKTGYQQGLLDNNRWLIAIKGIYSSIRTNSSMMTGGYGLGINVDIANTAFWSSEQQSFAHLACLFLKSSAREYRDMNEQKLAEELRPMKVEAGGRRGLGKSELFKNLERMKRLTFRVGHRGKMNDAKRYSVKGFTFNLDKWPQGANAQNITFEKKNVKTNTTSQISIYDYFKERYQIKLRYWQFPCIETTRDGSFPMEVVVLDPFQKYNYKLNGDQTSAMIKFAVTRPPQRVSDIMQCVKTLKWENDPYLKEYGISIKNQMEAVKARLIANPVVQFAKSSKNPGVTGRWDLRGAVFAKSNIRPLNAWGVIIVNKCIDEPSVMNFINTFIKQYKGHGGKIINVKPPIKHVQMIRSNQTGDDLRRAYEEVGMQFRASPDLFFVILPGKEQVTYDRLKKSFDVRFATLTQMIQASHAKKAQDQYCSNVAMKVNAKLGGYTSKLGVKAPLFGNAPTMMIGCDVSHGQHGSAQSHLEQPSLAAITMSMDKDCVQYAAAAQTNGYRVEVLDRRTVRSLYEPLIDRWCNLHQRAPEHVFYFRDGVSEGEFQKVLANEIDELRKIFVDKARGAKPKITVIVGTKRHHIRFFPQTSSGDKNGNAFPGTVVETEVTHPFHYDFYLCSHFALQGTARPVHYHVIQDEVNMPVDMLQNMIYQQCYQYMRSTTPVSLHPAIYYAHLAAARARPHENIAAAEKDYRNKAEEERHVMHKANAPVPSSKLLQGNAPDLLPIGDKNSGARDDNINFFKGTMWYI